MTKKIAMIPMTIAIAVTIVSRFVHFHAKRAIRWPRVDFGAGGFAAGGSDPVRFTFLGETPDATRSIRGEDGGSGTKTVYHGGRAARTQRGQRFASVRTAVSMP